jgi:hypothetical protein
MKKFIEHIVIACVVIFIISMLICCFFNPAPSVFVPIIGVSFFVPLTYCVFGYDKPIKYV